MEIILGVLIALIAVLLSCIVKQKRPKTEKPGDEKISDYKGLYQAKHILSKNEWYEYRKLRDLAAANDLQVCPKVRLLDIIEPRRGERNYMSLLGKIKSKHVDFLICDKDLRIKGIVELDDNSHDRADRQERDSFVDEILTDVGYKVIHTKAVTETTLEPITGAREPKAT